jgi:hypothetical protein
MGRVRNPFFPRKIDEQVADLNTKQTYLKENKIRFNIPEIELSELDTEVSEVNILHAIASNMDKRTRIDIAKRGLAIVTAQTTTRRLVDFYVVKNPNTTEVDYEALNIPVPGPKHPLPAPDYVPGIRHVSSNNLAVFAEFFDAKSDKRAKPAGVQAVEACFQLGGEQPADASVMSERRVVTSSPVHLQFGPESEFEVVFLGFRWVGTRGDYGPWSQVYKVLIAR